MQNQIYVYEGEKGTVTQQSSPETTIEEIPRHTGMRYDIVSQASIMFNTEYYVVASALIVSDARDIVAVLNPSYAGVKHLIIDTVKGEIL